MRHRRFIASGEHGRHLGGPHGVLQCHADGWPGSARRAAAHRVHHHQHGSVAGRQKAVDIGGRSGFLDAVARQILPHGNKEMFWIGHA